MPRKPVRFREGPWFAHWNLEPDGRGGTRGYVIILASSDMQGLKIADLFSGPSEQRIANAVVMAAAPELLAFAATSIRAARARRRLTTEEVTEGLRVMEKALHYETVEQYLRMKAGNEKTEEDPAV